MRAAVALLLVYVAGGTAGTYNIRHGRGMDGQVDLVRTAAADQPRILSVALLAEPALASGRRVLAVNVHFDWVESDTFRFRQAAAPAAVLDTGPPAAWRPAIGRVVTDANPSDKRAFVGTVTLP